MWLVIFLWGAAGVAVAADNPADMPQAPASSTEPASDPKPLSAQALAACEAAVSESLRTLRGPGVQRIEFIQGQPTTVSPQDEEVPLKGSGRYAKGGATDAAAVPFSYGCNYSVRTGKTNGVVLSDGKEAAANRSSARARGAGAGPAWQPDLARLSPEACEAAVAAVLKRKHPRVGRIAFDADSRQLKPAAQPERTWLQGQGGVQRAPGMAKSVLTYRCEFDDRSGALVDVQAGE
jgi:hypothetical protein